LSSAVDAHTDLSFGSEESLAKVINHAKKRYGKDITGIEIQKIDNKYL
jgi:hypothetical protein